MIIMAFRNNKDNIYAIDAFVMAKEAPTVRLQIKKYYNRIYYCAVVGRESEKQKVYFERELVSPER